MADRRMFTKKVTDDDNFTSLSASAQALYLHLSMSADDDGFSNQVSTSMFRSHASMQDLQALLEKRYIYQFDNGVIVIKHWRMANALRKDRYSPTAFQEELKKLGIKDNGSYTWLPNGCQVVATRLPQDRLDKDSIDNNICGQKKGQKEGQIEGHFDLFWKAYPKKIKKQDALKSFKKINPSDELFKEIMKGLEVAKGTYDWQKENGKYIPYPSTWLNGHRWEDEYGMQVVSAEGRQVDESRFNDINF